MQPFDPTAGVRARQIQADPGVARAILDPTDPRCGLPADWVEADEPRAAPEPAGWEVTRRKSR